jgi:hypothetical protein
VIGQQHRVPSFLPFLTSPSISLFLFSLSPSNLSKKLLSKVEPYILHLQSFGFNNDQSTVEVIEHTDSS